MVLENGCCDEEVQVQLYEARPGDPAVPQGKAFATISSAELGLPPHSEASCARVLYDCKSKCFILRTHVGLSRGTQCSLVFVNLCQLLTQ